MQDPRLIPVADLLMGLSLRLRAVEDNSLLFAEANRLAEQREVVEEDSLEVLSVLAAAAVRVTFILQDAVATEAGPGVFLLG